MIDYWQLFGIDTIGVLIWIGMMILAWYFQSNVGIGYYECWGISKAAAFFFLAAWIISGTFVNFAYSNTIEDDAVSYLYKASIEYGVDNEYTRDYYQRSDEEKNQIQFEINNSNLLLGQLGVQYNYGDAGKDKRYFALFWDSIAKMYFMPILIWGVLGVCTYPYIWYIKYKLSNDYKQECQSLNLVKKEMEKKQNKLKGLKFEYEANRNDIEMSKTEKMQIKTELNSIKLSLINLKATPEYQEYQKLKNDFQSLESTFKEKKSAYDNLEAKYNITKKKNESLKTENQKLMEENQSLSKENKEKKTTQTLTDAKFLQEMQDMFDE